MTPPRPSSRLERQQPADRGLQLGRPCDGTGLASSRKLVEVHSGTAESHTLARMLRAMRNYTSAWFTLGIVLAIAVMAIGWHAGLW